MCHSMYHVTKQKIWPPSDLWSKSAIEAHNYQFATVLSQTLYLCHKINLRSHIPPSQVNTIFMPLTTQGNDVQNCGTHCYFVLSCRYKLFVSLFYNKDKILKTVQWVNAFKILDAVHNVLGSNTFKVCTSLIYIVKHMKPHKVLHRFIQLNPGVGPEFTSHSLNRPPPKH